MEGYGIPATNMFVEKDDALNRDNRYKGKVLVYFDIEAMKGGKARYNYVSKNQWHKETVDSKGTFINSDKNIYDDGSIIVIDSAKNINDDFSNIKQLLKSK